MCLEFRRVLFRSEEHTSELQSHDNLVCRLLLEKKKPPRPPGCRGVASPPAPGAAGPRTGRGRGRGRGCLFFNDTATTEIYTLSLHDALPISWAVPASGGIADSRNNRPRTWSRDRKSTRLNSSHTIISYAVFCLKKKTHTNTPVACHTTQHDHTSRGVAAPPRC